MSVNNNDILHPTSVIIGLYTAFDYKQTIRGFIYPTVFDDTEAFFELIAVNCIHVAMGWKNMFNAFQLHFLCFLG